MEYKTPIIIIHPASHRMELSRYYWRGYITAAIIFSLAWFALFAIALIR